MQKYIKLLVIMTSWYHMVMLHALLVLCEGNKITKTKMSSFWQNFHHVLHWKLSKWQLSVQPVMKISSKWHFCFSDGLVDSHKKAQQIWFFSLLCWPGQAVELTAKLLVIWDPLKHMWHQSYDHMFLFQDQIMPAIIQSIACMDRYIDIDRITMTS